MSKLIAIRLKDELYNLLLEKANICNKNTSDYIRNAIISSKIDTTTKDKNKLIGAVNKIGNNINQIAYSLNIANKRNELQAVDYELLLTQLYIIENELMQLVKADNVS